jgi:hypothetical protein
MTVFLSGYFTRFAISVSTPWYLSGEPDTNTFQDVDHGIDLAAPLATFDSIIIIHYLLFLDALLHQLIDATDSSSTHGTLALEIDNLFNASRSEDVLACGYDRLMFRTLNGGHGFKTDRTLDLRVN